MIDARNTTGVPCITTCPATLPAEYGAVIITDRLGVSAMVDAAQPKELLDAACEAAARAATREVVRSAESAGAFARPQSVWVTRALSEINPQRMQVLVEWCPDPTEGVELRGGPLDGQIVRTRRGLLGRPDYRLTFPQPKHDVTAMHTTTTPAVFPQHADYERIGIDSEHDRWVYAHRP